MAFGSLIAINFGLAVLSVASAAEILPDCPSRCACRFQNSRTGNVDVNCSTTGNQTGEEERRTSAEIDNLLQLAGKAGITDTLSIRNSPLKELPCSFCGLSSSLNRVYLTNHKMLTRLPDNCFVRLPNLTIFNLQYSGVAELQDGVFDGLHYVYMIEMNDNRISSIGPRVFHNATDLRSLRMVDLRNNFLTCLEP